MKLHSLRLVNFRQHADTVVSFDVGLTGIIGPNGSGKTTILEAIAWALYGNLATRGNRDSIRFLRAGPKSSVRVELDFDLAGHRYRVVRGLTTAELYLDGAPAPIANTITGVTDLLQRRLGMTRSEFFNTYFTGQKELNVMAAMGPSDRAQFLSRVLGYEKLRTAQTLVRDKRKVITAELAGLRSAMPDPETVARVAAESEVRLASATRAVEESDRTRTEATDRLMELEPRWRSAQLERDRLQELLAESRVAESEEAGHARELARIAREMVAIGEAREELAGLARELAPLAELGEEFRRFERLAREEGKRQTLVEGQRALEEELVRLRDRKAKVDQAPELEADATASLEAHRRALDEAQATHEARRTVWVRDRQEAETKRDSLRVQYVEVKAQRDRIEELGPEGICPTCARRLGENFRAMLEQLDEQLETILVDGKFYNDRLEQLLAPPEAVRELDARRRQLQTEVGALERRLAKVQGAMVERVQLAKDIADKELRAASLARELEAIPHGYDAVRHAELRRDVERLAPLNERAARLSAQTEREGALLEEQRRVSDAIAAVRGRVAELGERRARIEFSETEFAALREAHERALMDARAAEIAAATARGDVAAARAMVDSALAAQADLARTQAQLDALVDERRLHEELDRAYSDLRSDLNAQLRPELSELAGAFLSELTDARYTELELDNDYNVLILEDGVPKPVISGGEEDLANLVLRLAISQMIAERAGQAFSLLVLDEVFGSLDESRRHNVVELLRRLQDRFEQVILITHIESVREGLDRVISVRYDEESGASVVTQGAGGATSVAASSEDDADLFEGMEAAS